MPSVQVAPPNRPMTPLAASLPTRVPRFPPARLWHETVPVSPSVVYVAVVGTGTRPGAMATS